MIRPSESDSFFDAVRRTALLGVQQAPLRVEPIDPAVDVLVAPRANEAAERTALRAAAVAGAMRRAGGVARPARAGEFSSAAGDDVRSRCGPRATNDLGTVLVDRRALAAEWLAAAARAGRRVPEEMLPELLDAFAKIAHDPDDLRVVLDARGAWLAPQHATWSYAVEREDPERTFVEDPSRAQRVRALRALRTIDAARGLALLEASWEREDAADRASFLEALGTGLSPTDEAFLERCRDDKRKDVRAAANALVHRLPGSRAAARALAWSSALVRTHRSFGVTSLVVALPEACTPEMVRDGVEPKPRDARTGERAWWLEQLVTMTPASALCERLDVTLPKLLQCARENEFADVLLRGLATAIARYRDAEALRTLLDLAQDDGAFAEFALLADHDALPLAVREAAALAALAGGLAHARALLATVPAPWGRELSRAALADARGGLAATGDWNTFTQRERHFDIIAARADPRTPGAADDWPETSDIGNVRTIVDRCLDTLSFRRAMLDTLESGA